VSFTFPSPPYKIKDKNVQNYNFTRFVQVRKLVSPTKERTQTQGLRKQGAEENIWTSEGGSGGRLEKTA
jgi:hypothetical protein